MIGHEPVLDRLNIVSGQDLNHTFEVIGDALPGGSVVTVQISDREHDYIYGTWPTTLDEGGWVVNVPSLDLATVPHGARFRVFVLYPTGSRYCWIAGPVNRSRR